MSGMEVTAKYLGQSKFEVIARGHSVICDQPLDNGGTDAGMTPPEFLLASLASCAGYYAAEYLRARGLRTELNVRVTAQKATQPARLAAFQIVVSVPGIEDRHQTGILRAVKSCLIHNTLLGDPELSIAIEGGPSAGTTSVLHRAA
jgi:uncharacterized OsmC-like protein